MFALKASKLGLISFIILDDLKDIQSVKSTWSNLNSELKSPHPTPLKGNNKGCKMFTQNSWGFTMSKLRGK